MQQLRLHFVKKQKKKDVTACVLVNTLMGKYCEKSTHGIVCMAGGSKVFFCSYRTGRRLCFFCLTISSFYVRLVSVYQRQQGRICV
jgi:hypothetical protein